MHSFAIYLVHKDNGPSLRVICTARDAAVARKGDSLDAFDMYVEALRDKEWVSLGPDDSGVATDLLALALASGHPPTITAIGDEPDMPVWVVMEGAVPTALIAGWYKRLDNTSGDQRTMAARA